MWEPNFAPIVRQLGLETLAIAITRMCQLYLGLRPDINWCTGTEDETCHQLMDYIMERGNFGRKAVTDSHKTVATLNVMQNIPTFLIRLQKYGMQNWPAMNNHPRLKTVLIPFAWLWQFCHYIYLGLKRVQPFKSLMQDIKKARSEDALMKKLGVNQRKN